jgi:hypothetical protein
VTLVALAGWLVFTGYVLAVAAVGDVPRGRYAWMERAWVAGVIVFGLACLAEARQSKRASLALGAAALLSCAPLAGFV